MAGGREIVYVVSNPATGLVKIGTTTNLQARLGQVESATEGPVDVLAILDGGRFLEAALHGRFRDYRRLGEWFSGLS